MTLDDLDKQARGGVPWDRYQWGGAFVSTDGTPAADFVRSDVADVYAWGGSGDHWDGSESGIVMLNDGRFVAWVSSYGPTGNGFSADAYGGDADIAFAADFETAKRHVPEQDRECWSFVRVVP